VKEDKNELVVEASPITQPLQKTISARPPHIENIVKKLETISNRNSL
jgi:hypothetical protein